MTTTRRALLVGAGHAHLHVAAHADRLARAGLDVSLIDPGTFWYSGRATGMLGGQFTAAQDQIDPRAVIENAGGRFIAGRVEHIDRAARQVRLDDGRHCDYDWLSVNVGSGVRQHAITGCADDTSCWPVKPIAQLDRLHRTLKHAYDAGETPAVVVVGGGATGCEIAANIAALARRASRPPTVTLLQAHDRLAPALPAGASRRLAHCLQAMGITLKFNTRAVERHGATLTLDNDASIAADHVVLATGLAAPAWLGGLGLRFDDGVVVDDTLRSVDDPRLFAVGDCARSDTHDRPRLGVFGVRQAPVLLANLEAVATGAPLQRYTPQSKWLSILDLGDGTGLATRGRHWWHGRTSAWLKHWLDRRFIDSYR